MSYELLGGLGANFRDQLASGPVERTSWQIAMRSFPPKLRSFGNPGGIGDYTSLADRQAYLAVPSMWTADPKYKKAGLYPVGDANVIRKFVDKLLNETNQALYGGRGLPQMVEAPAGTVDGVPVNAEIPTSGLSPAQIAMLQAAAQRGSIALGEAAQTLVESRAAATPTSNAARGEIAAQGELTGRAIQAAGTTAASVIAVATSTGLTNADIANQVLQGLSAGMLAVAPSIPFGIGFAVAGVLQIAAWIAGSWDHAFEQAEFGGYSTFWDDEVYRNVLRNRVLIQSCAERAALDKIKTMPIGTGAEQNSCKHWLIETSYGLENADTWTQKKSDHAIAGAMACARYLGDPLNDAQKIEGIGTYLRYVGASAEALEMVNHWLWDSRRIERINEGRKNGEISFSSRSYPDAEQIGEYPNYWRQWAYRGVTGANPRLYTRADLNALHAYVRSKIVRGASGSAANIRRTASGRFVAVRPGYRPKAWHAVAVGVPLAGLVVWLLNRKG